MKKKLITLAAVAVMGLASLGQMGCGSDHGIDKSLDTACSFNSFTSVSDGFMNGDEVVGTYDTAWSCTGDHTTVFDVFSIFTEGTGVSTISSAAVSFDWHQTGCTTLDYDSDEGTSGTWSQISTGPVTLSDGSTGYGLDFVNTADGTSSDVSCTLVTLTN